MEGGKGSLSDRREDRQIGRALLPKRALLERAIAR